MVAECCICCCSVSEATEFKHAGGEDYPVVTKCGHMFHHSCLSRWFKTKRVCPSCKMRVPGTGVIRVFTDMPEAGVDGDAGGKIDLTGAAGQGGGSSSDSNHADGEEAAAKAGGHSKADQRRDRASAAVGRRYRLLEEEVVALKRQLAEADSARDRREGELGSARQRLLTLQKELREAHMLGDHDRGEVQNLKRKQEKLQKEYDALRTSSAAQIDKLRTQHEQVRRRRRRRRRRAARPRCCLVRGVARWAVQARRPPAGRCARVAVGCGCRCWGCWCAAAA
jgi:hypothetical protein